MPTDLPEKIKKPKSRFMSDAWYADPHRWRNLLFRFIGMLLFLMAVNYFRYY